MVSYPTLLILAVFILIIFATRKKRENPLSLFLYIIYCVSFICAILLELFFLRDKSTTLESTIYLAVVLLLWIVPFNRIGFRSLRDLSYKYHTVSRWSILLVVASFLSIIFFSYYAVDVFLRGNLLNVRHDIAEGNEFARGGLLWTFFSFITPLYHVCLLLYFVALKDHWPSRLRNLLLAASLCFPIHVLTSFGRDGIVYWCLNVLCLYVMFHHSISTAAKAQLTKKFIVISSLLVLVFAFITYVRFGVASVNEKAYEGNVIHAVLDYIGQQPGNFSSAYDSDFVSSNKIYFPTFNALGVTFFGVGQVEPEDDDLLILLNMGLLSDHNVFGYFIKSLIRKSGKVLAFVISLVFFMLALSIRYVYRKSYTKLSLLIILFTLFQIPMNGVFYLRQTIGSFDMAYFMLFLTTGYLFFKKS